MYNTIKGNLRPIKDKVIVTDMHFGEQTTQAGIIIKDDDGTNQGIHPRWAKVWAKGPKNEDDFQVGDWVLIAHGRWTRGIKLETEDGEIIVRMIDNNDILMANHEKPNDVWVGTE
tara:strand:+ start:56 stop:400 length:345 start_codon:yes stop_codon:yes gene_type:complete